MRAPSIEQRTRQLEAGKACAAARRRKKAAAAVVGGRRERSVMGGRNGYERERRKSKQHGEADGEKDAEGKATYSPTIARSP